MQPKYLIVYFRAISNAIKREMDQEAEKLGLTAAQGMFLHRIWLSEKKLGRAIYARELEKFFCVKHSTVSGILTRMEEAGYLTFAPAREDRRCKAIHLTGKSMELHARMEALVSEMDGRLTRGMSREQAMEFRALLEIAAGNMGTPFSAHRTGGGKGAFGE